MLDLNRFAHFMRRTTLACTVLIAGTFFTASAALADMKLLPEASTVQFISVKNAAVAEVHHFTELSGGISGNRAAVDIPLASVETGIPIRNERMQKLLFNVAEFPTATIMASVDMDAVTALENGESLSMPVELTLSLHDFRQSIKADLMVAKLGSEVHVMTQSPIIIGANDFDLGAGVTALQKVAALQSISTAIPVTAHLVFSQ